MAVVSTRVHYIRHFNLWGNDQHSQHRDYCWVQLSSSVAYRVADCRLGECTASDATNHLG